ncbi:MAG TPA: phage tail protein, partial [Pseudomonadota bacterium]|nr:phage tail protein [Pseudomonadota bacterium]
MAVTGERRQVNSTYYFVVEIGNERSSYFRSVGGLKSEAEVVPMQEGGRNDTELRLIGRTKFPNLVLKQGFAGPELYNRREAFRQGSGARFNGAIIQMGPGSAEVCRWEFSKAWISKWDGPEYDGTKSEISVETIEIAHEGLSMSGGGGGGGGSRAANSAA